MTMSAQALRVRDPAPAAEPPSSRNGEAVPVSMLARILGALPPDRQLVLDDEMAAGSAGALRESVTRLAAHLTGLGLPARAPIGLCLPGGREALIALLAAEGAGLVPVLLPLDGNWTAAARAIEAQGIQAAITSVRFAGERPAERLREIAAGYFRLRFPMAFGPDVPDGIASLSAILARPVTQASRSSKNPGSEPGGLITFVRGAPDRPTFRPWSALAAAGAVILAATGIRPGERILNLIAPDDLAGLATGSIAALLAGAALESCPVFDAQSFVERLQIGSATHLVAPGWMEPHLARLALPDSLCSLVLVHRAPMRFGFESGLGDRRVVDVLAFDETALLAAPRQPGGMPGFAAGLDAGAETLSDLIRVRRDPDGTLSFSGPAACCGAANNGKVPDRAALGSWHSTCFTPETFAGLVVGVS